MSMENDTLTNGETLFLFCYDVESENGKALTKAQADWLRSERVEIWYTLRYKYKCVPVQNSLWLIRDPKTMQELEKEKDRWLEDYKKANFKSRIEIFPIQTNDVGYSTFREWEFSFILEWLGKIERALIKGRDTGKIGKKNIQAHTKKLQLLANILNEDFDNTFPNWKFAQDELGMVQDLLHQVQLYGV